MLSMGCGSDSLAAVAGGGVYCNPIFRLRYLSSKRIKCLNAGRQVS